MRKISAAAAAAGVALTVLAAPAAWADGPWIYNSDDHDAKAKFYDLGEKVTLWKLNNAYVYVKLEAYNSSGSLVEERRGNYDGPIDSSHTFDWAFAEGLNVYLKVCEQKGGIIPDDCSSWVYSGKS